MLQVWNDIHNNSRTSFTLQLVHQWWAICFSMGMAYIYIMYSSAYRSCIQPHWCSAGILPPVFNQQEGFLLKVLLILAREWACSFVVNQDSTVEVAISMGIIELESHIW